MVNEKIYLPFFNTLFCLFVLPHNGLASTSKALADENNWQKIDLVYYDKFPYKMDYRGIKIPDCTEVPANTQKKSKVFLLCKEHITLLRPASVINLWRQQQITKGYLSFSMKEFGIINVRAYITAVNQYIPAGKNNITPDTVPVTGKFMRYTLTVNHYTIKNNKTDAITVVNATPNHPFYVVNKHRFVPVSRVLQNDLLITLPNDRAHLIDYVNNNNQCNINSKKNTLTRVYNIEAQKKHVYFISKLNILVHNICPRLAAYHAHLKKHGIIKQHNIDGMPSVKIRVLKSNSRLLDREGRSALNDSGELKPEILRDIQRLGFNRLTRRRLYNFADEVRFNMSAFDKEELFTWELPSSITMEEHEAQLGISKSSSATAEAAHLMTSENTITKLPKGSRILMAEKHRNGKLSLIVETNSSVKTPAFMSLDDFFASTNNPKLSNGSTTIDASELAERYYSSLLKQDF